MGIKHLDHRKWSLYLSCLLVLLADKKQEKGINYALLKAIWQINSSKMQSSWEERIAIITFEVSAPRNSRIGSWRHRLLQLRGATDSSHWFGDCPVDASGCHMEFGEASWVPTVLPIFFQGKLFSLFIQNALVRQCLNLNKNKGNKGKALIKKLLTQSHVLILQMGKLSPREVK